MKKKKKMKNFELELKMLRCCLLNTMNMHTFLCLTFICT